MFSAYTLLFLFYDFAIAQNPFFYIVVYHLESGQFFFFLFEGLIIVLQLVFLFAGWC